MPYLRVHVGGGVRLNSKLRSGIIVRVCGNSANRSYSTSTRWGSRIRDSFSPPKPLHQKSFSTSSAVMTATKIDGNAIAKTIREKLHAEIEKTQKSNPRYKPSLKIIQGIFALH